MIRLFKPALIGSLLLLAGAMQYFVYTAYVSPREQSASDLAELTNVLQLENRKQAVKRPVENRGATIPDLLSRVQDIASQNAVLLTRVEPVAADPEQFKLSANATYRNLLKFLARFETLQVEISGFNIAPSKDSTDSLEVSVNFNHTAAAGGVASDRIRTFLDRIGKSPLADPFYADSAAPETAVSHDSDDLSWTFRLTSISEVGKTKYATIDGKDYNVGDALDGYVIEAISSDNVTLIDEEHGEQRPRLLTFRNQFKHPT